MCRMSRAEQGSMARGKGRAQQSSTHAHERRMRARAHATHARGMQRKHNGAEQSGDEQKHERGEAGMESKGGLGGFRHWRARSHRRRFPTSLIFQTIAESSIL